MSLIKKLSAVTSLLIVAGLTTNALAATIEIDTENENKNETWDIKLGLGAAAVSSPWQGVDNQVVAMPMINITKGNWHIGGEGLVSYEFDLSHDIDFHLGVGYRDDGYDGFLMNKSSKSKVFDGYKSPDGEFLINYGLSYKFLTFSASRDVSNKSESNSASLSANIPLYQDDNGLKVMANVSALWYDTDYVNYVYGVSANNAELSVGRTTYQTSSAVNYNAGLRLLYPINKQLTITSAFNYTLLDDSIADSPLIGKDHQSALFLGVMYHF